MKRAAGIWLATLAILLGSQDAFSASSDPQEFSQLLTWRKNKSADARIENLPLPKVLARLSAATGWKILVQPGLDQKVSVQF
ncbi:MAG: hypothetical protein ACXW32_15035, partial [Limisphaerales bacterium]